MAATPGDQRLGRDARLKQRRDFAQIKQLGQRLALGCLVANWRVLAAPAQSRVGVVTSRRIGPSVVRSHARRLIRETFRLHRDELSQPVDIVLVARPSIVGKSFTEVERDLLTTLRKARLLR